MATISKFNRNISADGKVTINGSEVNFNMNYKEGTAPTTVGFNFQLADGTWCSGSVTADKIEHYSVNNGMVSTSTLAEIEIEGKYILEHYETV